MSLYKLVFIKLHQHRNKLHIRLMLVPKLRNWDSTFQKRLIEKIKQKTLSRLLDVSHGAFVRISTPVSLVQFPSGVSNTYPIICVKFIYIRPYMVLLYGQCVF